MSNTNKKNPFYTSPFLTMLFLFRFPNLRPDFTTVPATSQSRSTWLTSTSKRPWCAWQARSGTCRGRPTVRHCLREHSGNNFTKSPHFVGSFLNSLEFLAFFNLINKGFDFYSNWVFHFFFLSTWAIILSLFKRF
jgi:hypothetical protein